MKNQNNETDFEKRAKRLLEFLSPEKRANFPRPFIVEVTGSPDSGKTTALKILDSFFRRQQYKGNKYRVYKPLEGAEAIRSIPRTSHMYNVATGLYALEILRDQSYSSVFELILFDRCVHDTWCWMEYWLRKKDITQKHADYLKRWFTQDIWRKNIDICFFVMCDPKIAIERDQKWSLTKKSGSFTNLETVTELYNIFETGYNHFKKRNAPVALIDTTKLNPRQVAFEVLNHALDAFERRFKGELK